MRVMRRHASFISASVVSTPFVQDCERAWIAVDRDTERLRHAVGGDVIVIRPDPTGGEDIGAAIPERIECIDDRFLHRRPPALHSARGNPVRRPQGLAGQLRLQLEATLEAQWYAARWSIGVIGLIMDGIRPERVADQIIYDLRKRERNGLIELPKRPGLKPGDQVRILQGPFAGQLGLYAGMCAHERVLVLLALLGGQQRVELARDGIEAVGRP
jgi:hypothetical protein